MSDVFDIGRSEWEVLITEDELDTLWQVVSGRDVSVQDEVVWLTAEPSGQRTWMFGSSDCTGWLHTTGVGTSEVCVVPFTRLYIVNIRDLITADKDCTVYYNSNEDAIVARIGDRVVFGDYPRQSKPYNKALLIEGQRLLDKSGVRTEFDSQTFREFIRPMCYAPFGIDFDKASITPNAAWSVTPHQVRVTLDWTRFGSTCITTAVAVSSTGTVQFSADAVPVGRHWGNLPLTDNVVMIYDEVKQDYVYFSCGNLGLRVPMNSHDTLRWYRRLLNRLDAEEYKHSAVRSGHLPNEVSFVSSDIEMTAHIITRDSDENDRIRISMLLSDVAGDNEATLREINHLNNTLVDVRLVLQDSQIFAVIDFPASEMERLAVAATRLCQVSEQNKGLDVLFASIA